MSYSQFTLPQVIEQFNLIIAEEQHLVVDLKPVELSDFLKQILDFNIPLAVAVATEKARSEFIIAPLLIELKKTKNWALFSGVEFNVDTSQGLTGFVDFLLSHDPEQLFIKAPVAVVIEAKKDDISSGLGQCVATMVAAQVFNLRREQELKIKGAVTTGTTWRLLALDGNNLVIDLTEYFDFGKILAFFQS